MEVDLFIPCFIDQIYPQAALSTVKVLEKAGVKVHYNPKQTCCGQMAFNAGFWDEAKVLGEKLINDFSSDRYIVSPSASCVGMVRNYYAELFYNSAMHNKYMKMQKRIFELTDFLVNVMKVTDLGASFPATATYHDSCSAIREYGIRKQPRILLNNVKGLNLIEMKETEVCCGFGGTFAVKHEPISVAMAEQKIQNAMETQAEYIISTDSSCLMHLQGYIGKNKMPLKTIHIAEVLASGY